MAVWTLVENHPTQGRTFRRPLEGVELGLFWTSHLNGTADNLHHAELRLVNASQDVHLFSEGNIVEAWLSTKRRFPLSAATMQVVPEVATSDLEPHFNIREHDLAILRPCEIIFGQVACAEEVQERIAAIWGGPRPLSGELLAQLYVFRETDPRRAMDTLHLMTLMAHCVTDGMANRTFMRCLVDTLARSGGNNLELAQAPLEDRLAMAIPLAGLQPAHLRLLSRARLRWRRAIGTVIFQSRLANSRGGHTLPCRLTRTTPQTPARTGFVSTLLSQDQTIRVISNCRSHGVTFGSAYLALAQVAMTRVLYRRYLRGEISEEEWAYRKRQPYSSIGPINLRPYLDKSWFERGGGGEFMSAINVVVYSLPFMTLAKTERHQYCEDSLSDGAPPFSDLLTFGRFLHRATIVKKQTKAFSDHPLFFEILQASNQYFVHSSRLTALEWMATKTVNPSGAHKDLMEDEVLGVTDIPVVFAHGGSSLGNMHLIFPTEYPLPSTHPLSPLSPVPHPARAGYVSSTPPPSADAAPRVLVGNSTSRLHARPAELYLGALTSNGRLSIYASYDGNVYEDKVVREWLDEVKAAVLWYLDQTHQSCQDQVCQDIYAPQT